MAMASLSEAEQNLLDEYQNILERLKSAGWNSMGVLSKYTEEANLHLPSFQLADDNLCGESVLFDCLKHLLEAMSEEESKACEGHCGCAYDSLEDIG